MPVSNFQRGNPVLYARITSRGHHVNAKIIVPPVHLPFLRLEKQIPACTVVFRSKAVFKTQVLCPKVLIPVRARLEIVRRLTGSDVLGSERYWSLTRHSEWAVPYSGLLRRP